MTTATETTFKEPFLGKIRDALDGAVSITWDGCHKIYVHLDQAGHDDSERFGYENIMVKSVDDALGEMWEMFSVSCSLRFIQSVSETGYRPLIGQFEYDED